MIWDSSYWKIDLLRKAKLLEKRMSQKRWTEGSKANFEKTIMIGFYIIRKLVEADKLSGKLCSKKLHAYTFRCKNKVVNKLNWHNVLELYDMNNSKEENLAVTYIANKIIHSFVFLGVFGTNNRIEAIVFNSDRSKNELLHSIELKDIIEFFDLCGSDFPKSIMYKNIIGSKKMVSSM